MLISSCMRCLRSGRLTGSDKNVVEKWYYTFGSSMHRRRRRIETWTLGISQQMIKELCTEKKYIQEVTSYIGSIATEILIAILFKMLACC